MLSIPEALAVQADNGRHKARGMHTPARFTVSGMLAGAYIGVGVVLMVTAAGPLLATGSGWAKLVSGLVFGVALTIVVVAGGELVTSTMMTLPQAALMRAVPPGRAATAMLWTFAANLVGSMAFAALVVASGVLHSNAAAGGMIAGMLSAKAHETPAELFVRGILCNMLVCVAVWMTVRLRSETARVLVVFAAILAFITSGFEHVVANMTTFTIGLLTGDASATLPMFALNLLCVGLGNLVGGGVVIGAGYWIVGGSPRLRDVPKSASHAQVGERSAG
ncbi:formate/nitrite transporter family protein [Microbacterium oleivorans]|uniref:Formate/nitrite transporter family protein n=1 Tax=Microbacterium oleivorans TaxID=273677 RepID=A0A7D5EZ77_9MICO|nr:formate/nitrite transporter family protein [Microbacterium oleivorans]QLD13070.1 formate/nitrite transporter family protein [Microbacterium oleivorans]